MGLRVIRGARLGVAFGAVLSVGMLGGVAIADSGDVTFHACLSN